MNTANGVACKHNGFCKKWLFGTINTVFLVVMKGGIDQHFIVWRN